MAKIEKIDLSPIEATAYWWVNLIKRKVKEITINGTHQLNEKKFGEIFYGFTETDWRNLYLQLIPYITEDVDKYMTKRNNDEENAFNQDTDKNGHNRINEEISKIIKKQLPNIRLAGNGVKDYIIYTTHERAYVYYKSCGIINLPTIYEPDYVLTGNEDALNFYNSLISTIAIINQENSNFHSMPVLREIFCNEYVKLSNSKEKLENIIEAFNYAFNKANDEDLIMGSSHNITYFPRWFCKIDFLGLDSYVDLAKHYANAILKNDKNNDISYCQKLKRKYNN